MEICEVFTLSVVNVKKIIIGALIVVIWGPSQSQMPFLRVFV
jgi:hypothetical protein